MIFVMKFQAAAMSRVDTPENDRKDFCLFVDEFQNFSTDSFESILSEARKFRLNLFVANQFMTQLTDKIREGVLGNVGTVIAGRVGVTDAEMLEKVFAPTFKAEDLHKQPNFHAIATVMMYDMPTAPFTMNLLPPMGEENRDVFKSLKNYSATKYGRPIAEVEREINERMSPKKPKEEVMPETATAELFDEFDELGEMEVKAQTKRPNFLDEWKGKTASDQAAGDVAGETGQSSGGMTGMTGQSPEEAMGATEQAAERPEEALREAEAQLADLERRVKRKQEEMSDGDVIKLH